MGTATEIMGAVGVELGRRHSRHAGFFGLQVDADGDAFLGQAAAVTRSFDPAFTAAWLARFGAAGAVPRPWWLTGSLQHAWQAAPWLTGDGTERAPHPRRRQRAAQPQV